MQPGLTFHLWIIYITSANWKKENTLRHLVVMAYIALGNFLLILLTWFRVVVVRVERWCFKMCRTMAFLNAMIIGDERRCYLGYLGVRAKAKCRVAMGLISIDGLASAFEIPIKTVMWRRAW